MKARILTVGTDMVLVESRALILNRHYDVVCAEPGQALEFLRKDTFDLLLVCSSIPFDRASSLIRQAHEEFPHLCIVRMLSPDTPLPASPVAHALVTVDYHPESWIKAVDRLLSPGEKAAFH